MKPDEYSEEICAYTNGRIATFPCSKRKGGGCHVWAPAVGNDFRDIEGMSECIFCGEWSLNPGFKP